MNKMGKKRKGAGEICDPRQRAAISQSNANNARYWNELRQLSCLVDSENAESARADRSFANVSSREGNIRECTRHRSKFKRRVESVTCCWNSRTPQPLLREGLNYNLVSFLSQLILVLTCLRVCNASNTHPLLLPR